MSDETTTEQLAEIDRDIVEIETLVAELAREALQADYPQQVETTTDTLTEIEGQADGITPDDVAGEALAGVWDQVQAERTIEDLQHRLDVVSKEWAEQAATINGLQQQLEAVKAELMRVSHDRYQLQIELDAAQQVPQAVSDRFEEGWDAGTARTVETIAEWTEPFRTCGSERLAWMVMQNLPHIMRSLTGLTPED